MVPGSAAAPGVRDAKIKIGVHLPLTGASPVASSTAPKGARLLWKWLRLKNHPVHGRHGRVLVRNDNFNPSQAVAVCKEMVEEKHVFMLTGMPSHSGNVDQMTACARYARSVGVPYVSIGTTEMPLKALRTYFAVTVTMPDQSSLLADYLTEGRSRRNDKNGILWFNSPAYKETHTSIARAFNRRETPFDYDRSIPNQSGSAEAQQAVQEMKLAEIDNVVVLVTPIFFLQLLSAANSNDYHPLWTGPGLTMTSTDDVARVGCGDANLKARFLSPLPATADRAAFDPAYDKAVRKIYPEEHPTDAFLWQGWATSKVLRSMLDRAGRDLTRKGFVRKVERARGIRTGILPPIGFSPDDHFGGRGTYLLKADCQTDAWKTIEKITRR
jgi:ABC-type branched-subunit amino acid transport system substrate-binding protein